MINKTIAALIPFLLIIASCSPRADNTEEKLQAGTAGLELEFIKQGIPKQITEQNQLYGMIELRNKGYYDINDALLVLSLEKDLLEIDSWDMPETFRKNSDNTVSFSLKGKSLSNSNGEKQVVTAVINSREIDETRNKIESIISAAACYPYSTVFSGTICIDTDPNNLRIAEKTCETRDILASSQGAPVAITRIEQKVLPGSSSSNIRLQFTVYAENKGRGIIIDPYRYKEICLGKNIRKQDYNSLIMESFEFSGYMYEYGEDYEIDCIPNPMKETKDSYYTKCTLKEISSIPKSRLTFETPLVIQLSYGYSTTETHEISILNNEQEII
ncbi:hypothetical protein GF323_07040 [Candidatus Woesearchaeota archaeon]|nr:hypothetical protein [Candidatus Woesearchaeota archaeon]